jgi:2-hydroxychromene-2-carboxylate isomerase
MAGAADIDFWFDFISPYGYLASLRIDALAARHGRHVRWHPMLLGVTVLKVMGLKPLMDTPLKRDYVVREIARYARRHGIELARALDAAPMNPLAAARVFAWLLARESQSAKPFARAVLHRYWAEGIDVDTEAELEACAAVADMPRGQVANALKDPLTPSLLRAEVDAAVARGVFGSPFVVVDGEPFFGVDKLELIDDWLAGGGW